MFKKMKYIIPLFLVVLYVFYGAIDKDSFAQQRLYKANQNMPIDTVTYKYQGGVQNQTGIYSYQTARNVLQFFNSSGTRIMTISTDSISIRSGIALLDSIEAITQLNFLINGTSEKTITSTTETIPSNNLTLTLGALTVSAGQIVATDGSVNADSVETDTIVSVTSLVTRVGTTNEMVQTASTTTIGSNNLVLTAGTFTGAILAYTHITDTAGLGALGDNIIVMVADSIGVTTNGGSAADSVRWFDLHATGNTTE